VSSRGRKPKGTPDVFAVVRAVYFMRYGLSIVRGQMPDLGRRPGTVNAYRAHGGPVPAPECTVLEACKRLELTMKSPLRQQARHPVTGELEEWDLTPLIAKRRSDEVMPEGEATRRALYRALRLEERKDTEFKLRAGQADWRDKLAERRQKKARRRI
jgi:hypothetical protein